MSEFFAYRHGELHAEDVPVAEIAAAVGTPFYLYSAASFTAQYRALAEALAAFDPLICYAVKANPNLAVVRLFGRLGAGADVVSEGELRRAFAAGIPPERIIFSGVGKTRAELDFALAAGIHQINIESVPELRCLADRAASAGRTARVAIRINPDIDAHTHAGVSTGKKEDKFGVPYGEVAAAYRLAADLPGIEPVGLAVHIGSQIHDLGPSGEAFARAAALVRDIRASGLPVRTLDLGGGLTIPYRDGDPVASPLDYAGKIAEAAGPLDVRLAFEPGRFLVGAGGVLVSTVVYVKEAATRVVVVDAAMNDLVRPAMYGEADAWHRIAPGREPPAHAREAPADVVGPVCETTDTFARGRLLPPLAEGDLVVFHTAGAYGASMGSTYNTRPLAPEVLVSGGRYDVIRARQNYEAMLALDAVPDWLSGKGGEV